MDPNTPIHPRLQAQEANEIAQLPTEQGSSKAKRKNQGVKMDSELKLLLDPDGKLNRHQLREAIARYRTEQLPVDILSKRARHGCQSSLEILSHRLDDKVLLQEITSDNIRALQVKEAKLLERQRKNSQNNTNNRVPSHPLSSRNEWDLLNASDYYCVDSIRCVWPYHLCVEARIKERWVGLNIYEMTKNEFPAFHDGYIESAIANGQIFVNNVPVYSSSSHYQSVPQHQYQGPLADCSQDSTVASTQAPLSLAPSPVASATTTTTTEPDQRLRIDADSYTFVMGDVFQHMCHVHEPPVPDTPVEVVVFDEPRQLLIINKPSGIPVHPNARYRLNSVTNILLKQFAFQSQTNPLQTADPHTASGLAALRQLFSVHRLDRPTSGLLLLATTPSAAAVISREMRDRDVRKHYLARVAGQFPIALTLDHTVLTKMCNTKVLYDSPDSQNIHNDVDVDDVGDNRENPHPGSGMLPPVDGTTAWQNAPTWQSFSHPLSSADDSETTVPNPFHAILWNGVGCRSVTSPDAPKHPHSGHLLSKPSQVEIVIDRPISKIDPQLGIMRCEPLSPADRQLHLNCDKFKMDATDGKPALTVVRGLSYDPVTNTSLVHCMPRTGRTHQIRVHLEHIGFPIVNDKQYGGPAIAPHVLDNISAGVTMSGGGTEQSLSTQDDSQHFAHQAYYTQCDQADAHHPSSSCQYLPQQIEPPSRERLSQLWAQSSKTTCQFCQDPDAGLWSNKRNNATIEKVDLINGLISRTQSTTRHVQLDNGRNVILSPDLLKYPPDYLQHNLCWQPAPSMSDSREHTEESSIPTIDGAPTVMMHPAVMSINPTDDTICLHAIRYETSSWTYYTPNPPWAHYPRLFIPPIYYAGDDYI